jgi:cytochrome c-type biogenesis protein CcmE
MSRKTLRVVVSSAVLAAAVIGVVQLLGNGDPTCLTVDQIVSDPARWQGENVSVKGTVQPGSRARGPSGDWRFNVVSQGQTLSVRYTGVMPDTFVDAAEVLMVGELRPREFSARNVLVRVLG